MSTAFPVVLNYIKATLASSLGGLVGDTTAVLTASQGAQFGSAFPIYIAVYSRNGLTNVNFEIVRITGRTADSLTIVRAQCGTAVVFHPAGSYVRCPSVAELWTVAYAAITAQENGTAIEVETPSATQSIVAATGITAGMIALGRTIAVVGDGGPVTITANPQIAAGANGQRVTILGTHDTNTVTFSHGTGILMLYPGLTVELKNGDSITLQYITAVGWREESHALH